MEHLYGRISERPLPIPCSTDRGPRVVRCGCECGDGGLLWDCSFRGWKFSVSKTVNVLCIDRRFSVALRGHTHFSRPTSVPCCTRRWEIFMVPDTQYKLKNHSCSPDRTVRSHRAHSTYREFTRKGVLSYSSLSSRHRSLVGWV